MALVDETEEDFKARVLAWLGSAGAGCAQLRFERPVRLRVGHQVVDLGAEGATITLRGRYDLLLVNDVGRNVLLAELKRPGEPMGDDERDQALYYARLQQQMPPLVLVSNGTDTRLYDTLSFEEVTSAELPSRWSKAVSGGLTVSVDDLRLREEALRFFIGYSNGNVQAFCAAQQKGRMAGLRGDPATRTKKYLPHVYVPRSAMRDALAAFLVSKSPAFVLAGPSGVGKTNEFCALTEESRTSHLALFFSGSELADKPAKALAEEFNWEFSDQLPLQKICDRLVSLVRGSSRRVLVFIDAIDECALPMIEQSLSDLAHHFDAHEGVLKLLVSLKGTQWERFAHFGDGASPLARLCFRVDRPGDPGGAERADPSFELQPMTPTELDVAIEKYAACFSLTGEITGEARQEVRDPFALRVLSEVCADGALPVPSLRRDQMPLVRRYVDAKLLKADAKTRPALLLALASVGRALMNATAGAIGSAEVHSVRESDALAHMPQTAWLELPGEAFDLGLLVRERDAMGRTHVGFQYDRIRDHVIVFHVLQLDTLTRQQFGAGLEGWLRNAVAGAAVMSYLEGSPAAIHGDALRDLASRRAEQFLTVYDEIRQRMSPILRSHMNPRTEGTIGLVCSFHGQLRWTYGFFVRDAGQAPVVVRPDYADEWDRLSRGQGDQTVPLTQGWWSTTAWPLVLDPDKLAAHVALEQIRKAVSEGALDETVSTTIEMEKVFAITGRHRGDLGFSHAPWHRSQAMAQLATDLLPIDLDQLSRRVHGALGKHQANTAVALRGGTHAEMVEAMKEARRQALEGRRFDHPVNVRPVPALQVLAGVLDRVRPAMPELTKHFLPAPEFDRSVSDTSESHFEDAYSDGRWALLIAELWVLQLDEYMRIVDANLPLLRSRLSQYTQLPQHFVLFYSRPRGPARLGLEGTLDYARIDWDAPFPLAPGAALASGRSGKVQVFRRSDASPFACGQDGSWRLASSDVRARFPGGLGGCGVSSLFGRCDVPLGWDGERSYDLMPVRNRVYEFLQDDLKKLDAAAVLACHLAGSGPDE